MQPSHLSKRWVYSPTYTLRELLVVLEVESFLRTKTEERSLPDFRNGTDRRKAAKARR